jgi:hypothetical protein
MMSNQTFLDAGNVGARQSDADAVALSLLLDFLSLSSLRAMRHIERAKASSAEDEFIRNEIQAREEERKEGNARRLRDGLHTMVEFDEKPGELNLEDAMSTKMVEVLARSRTRRADAAEGKHTSSQSTHQVKDRRAHVTDF